MALYELTKTSITALKPTQFSTQVINERLDLQRLLKQNIEAISPGTMTTAVEVCD